MQVCQVYGEIKNVEEEEGTDTEYNATWASLSTSVCRRLLFAEWRTPQKIDTE